MNPRDHALKPERSRLIEATKIANRAHSAEEAWENLYNKGLIPESWLNDPKRRFIHENRNADAVQVEDLPTVPSNRSLAALYASDPEGIATAEELARTIVRRVRSTSWQQSGIDDSSSLARKPIVWRAVSTNWRDARPRVYNYAVYNPARLALYGDGHLPRSSNIDVVSVDQIIDIQTLFMQEWDQATREDLSAQYNIAGQRRSVPFADMPNPYAPMVALWCTGYALEMIRWDAIYMAAPKMTKQERDRLDEAASKRPKR